MHRSVALRLLLPALLIAGCFVTATAKPAGDPAYTAEPLADGVLLFRPADDSRARTNSLVVERSDGLLVVEAQPTPEAARELLAAIAGISDAPVRYLVLSHPHVEVTGGATGFPKETLVVASRATRQALEEEGDLGAEIRARSLDPAAFEAPERRLPVLILSASALLEDSRNPVKLRPIQSSHSRGDMVIELKDGRLLYAGALLFPEEAPYATDANMTGWVRVLNSLIVEAPEIFIPLRGPAQASRQVRTQRDGLAWIRGQIEFGFVEQKTAEEIPAFVLEDDKITRYFGLDDPFLDTLIQRVLDDTVATRKKRGL